MKWYKKTAIVLLVALVGIQFIPTARNQSDVVPATDFMMVNEVPKAINDKLQGSCYDCHSNNTRYPWYSNIQPGAWFMEMHINNGKEELNFNEWGKYSNRKKTSKLKSIISQIRDDEMPIMSYRLIHKDAIFSDDEKKTVIEWVTKLKESL
tara:strand:+ start:1020 stop:1472 length:453 start_codon:yes stop_codon:yes gene_type:complete